MSTTEVGRLTALGTPDGSSAPGVSLQAVIESTRRLDELSCARVVGNLASVVHAAQQGGQPLGILTPAAVVVLPDGSVKLTAGVASLHYTAPEKLRGVAGDRRTDVFALGVVLWEALAHARLFGGANDDAIRQAVLASEFRSPSELNANVPAELDAICKKALARDPSDRYQSAKVMAAEIEAVLDDAGYPASNEPIARYVAKALATEPASAPVVPASQPPSKAAPLASVVPSMPGGTLPPPAFIPRQAGQTAIVGALPAPVELVPPAGSPSPSSSPPVAEPPQKRPPAKSSKTEILGSLSPAGSVSPVTEKPSMGGVVTAFLGSNASLIPEAPGTAPPAPPQVSIAAGSPSLGPPDMPAPAPATMPAVRPATPSPEPADRVIAPGPVPPNKPSIANAETITTPQLPQQHAALPAPRQLGMPPGMTVPPASPGAPLQSADRKVQESEEERHADRAEVIGLPQADRPGTGGRDVLAGWGWTTGSVQAIDDEDVYDTARASRKRLLIAIGGALGGVIIIAILAFAFSGSKPPGDPGPSSSAARSSATAAVPLAAPEPGATRPEPSNPTPGPATPEPSAPPAAPEPAKAEPPKAEPPSAESATAAPARAEPPSAAPPTAAPATPEPAKIALPVKGPEPAKAEPPKKLDAKRLDAKKLDAKKQPDRSVKRPPPPDNPDKLIKSTARAQPQDPYATSADKPGGDPASAYKTGLQQYARGDTTGALSTLRTSLASNPTFAPTWRGLGLVYEKLGNKDQARSAWKRYLQLAPDGSDAEQIRERLERL
ncbi:MAG TPA: tetratricopeptide repeat protein [Kofleriaceae bacterium]|nr:tetratricopeptide repeat protein [Kofleriaceae bacterium]